MRSFVRFVFSLLSVLVVAGGWTTLHAQSLKLAWDQAAPTNATSFTSAQAQAYTYKYYLVGGTNTGTPLSSVACTTTNAPLVKTCTAPLPAALQGGQQVNITASNQLGESGHSNDAELPPPPPAPMNLRTIGVRLIRPFVAMGSLLRGVR